MDLTDDMIARYPTDGPDEKKTTRDIAGDKLVALKAVCTAEEFAEILSRVGVVANP